MDPFGGKALSFETLRALASIGTMDLILHFPTSGFKRNLKTADYTRYYERFLGLPASEWGVKLISPSDIPKLIVVLKRQLETLGYKPDLNRMPVIKNSKNAPLYHLVYGSKHDLGGKIWNNVTKKEPSGQTGFGGQGFDG